MVADADYRIAHLVHFVGFTGGTGTWCLAAKKAAAMGYDSGRLK
jgi:hypothetical protein